MNNRWPIRFAHWGAVLVCIVAADIQPVMAQTGGMPLPLQTNPEAVLANKIDAAVNTCAAAFVSHRITTHVDAVICVTGPFTKAFQEAGFQDMDLVFEYESAALDAASKLDHGQSTESDFRAGLTQAMLHMRAQEAQRADRRAQEMAAQQQSEITQAQAQADAQQAESRSEREIRISQRHAAIQQIIQNQQVEERIQQENTAAFMGAISNLMGGRRPANCTTLLSETLATTNCH